MSRFLFRPPFSIAACAFAAACPSFAFAQNAAIRPATPQLPGAIAPVEIPGALAGTSAVRTATASVNVLILPFDAINGTLDIARISVLPEYGRIPGAPRSEGGYSVETRVFAQQKPKDEPFRAAPEVWGAFPAKKPGAPAADAPKIEEGAGPFPGELPGGVRLSDVPAEVGAASGAAAPLRRALVRNGFLDVLTAAPDGAAVRRALNERRLSQRALDRLQNAMIALSAATQGEKPAPADVQEEGIAAASQIGQALGYRSVVALAVVPTAADATMPAPRSTYSMLLVDADRESGEALAFDEPGAPSLAASEAAASTGAALLDKKIDLWPASTSNDRAARAALYLERARKNLAQRDAPGAMEALNQSLALNPSQREAQVLLGDVLQTIDPLGAAAAYRRALEGGAAEPGQTWEKIAQSYVAAKDWPRTLEAGRSALALRWDSATLRMAMATAQFGRAILFRNADSPERAEEAENEARAHLDRARSLAPDDPKIARLLVAQLVSQNRLREASEALDKLMATVETPDLELLQLYATTLTDRGGREAEAFSAWARVWRQSGVSIAPMNAVRYRRIAEGFDQYASDSARQAAQLSAGVSNATLPRESALLQLQKIHEDMKQAEAAIKVLQPPAGGRNEANHAARVFASTTITQAVNAHRIFVETGNETHRSRANELHRQAIMQINIARGARAGSQ